MVRRPAMTELTPPDSRPEIESAIDNALVAMSVLPGFLGTKFNPRPLIIAVNELQKLPQEHAGRVLLSYSERAWSEPDSIFDRVLLVARVLFTPKDGSPPVPSLNQGMPDLQEPEDRTLIPLFPLHVYRGIPFLLVGGYLVGGEPESPAAYLAWCAEYCRVRSTPIIPDDDPLASVDEFLQSSAWKELNPKPWHYGMLRHQALRLVANVYTVPKDAESDLLVSEDREEIWKQHRRAFAAENVRWSQEANDYLRTPMGKA